MKSNVCTIVPWSCGPERFAYMMYRKWLKANEVRKQGQTAEAGTGPGSIGRKQGQSAEAGNRAKAV